MKYINFHQSYSLVSHIFDLISYIYNLFICIYSLLTHMFELASFLHKLLTCKHDLISTMFDIIYTPVSKFCQLGAAIVSISHQYL